MHTVPEENRRAFLVGVELKPVRTAHGLHGSHLSDWSVLDSLAELARLADTAGLRVVGSTWQKLDRPDPGTYVGSGKVREVREAAAAENAGYVLFDDELSPGQQKKLEKEIGPGVRLLDRTRLILDIFSLHAHSREGKLQVELAQHEYLLPRLTGLRADLAQQTGGAGAGPVGVRGPGETQLEMDRRQVRRRIGKLHEELEEVRSHRRQGRAEARPGGHAPRGARGLHQRGQELDLERPHGRRGAGAGQALRHPRPDHPAPPPAERPGGAPRRHGRLHP